MLLNDVNTQIVESALTESVIHDTSSIFLTTSSYVVLYVFFAVCSLTLAIVGKAIYKCERRLTSFHVVLSLWLVLLGFPISPLFGYKIVILKAIGMGTGFLSSILCLILITLAWVRFCKLVSLSAKLKFLSRNRGKELRNSKAIEIAILTSVVAVIGFIVALTFPILV